MKIQSRAPSFVTLAIATPEAVAWGEAPHEVLPLTVEAMESDAPAWEERGSERMLAIPTYDEEDRVVGAVIASTSRGPARASMLRFGLATGAGSLFLILLGSVTSRRISRRVLAATIDGVT